MKTTIEVTDKGFFLVETINRKKHRREISKDDILDLLRIQQKPDYENKLILELGETEIKIIEYENGVSKVKYIDPDSLIELLANSQKVDRKTIKPLGMLPKRLVYIAFEEPTGEQKVLIYEPGGFAEFKTPTKNYGEIEFPNMMFLFNVFQKRVLSVSAVCVKEKYENLKPDTKLYYYPYAHVSQYNFSVCTGSIVLPNITSLHQLNGFPFLIRDGYHVLTHSPGPNKDNIPLESLLEKLSNKELSVNDILVETSYTLESFINTYMS